MPLRLETDDKDLLSLSYSSLGDCYHELKDDENRTMPMINR